VYAKSEASFSHQGKKKRVVTVDLDNPESAG
jgi:hypothetical protein